MKQENGKIKVEKIKLKDKNKSKYVDTLSRIAASAGQDPGKHAQNWVNVADFLIIAKQDSKTIGFSAYKRFNDNFVHIAATMILPEYQGKGVGGKMTRLIIKDSIKFKLSKTFRNPFSFSIFKPLYIFFRTQNPSVYAGFYGRTRVYPNASKKELPESVLSELLEFTKTLWPGAELDRKKLVINNAYTNNPGLALSPDEVPWSKNKEIDEFFAKTLGLTERSEKAMLVISEITLLSLLKIKP